MKKLLFILSIFLVFACNSDDDAGDVITNEFEQINVILPQGIWKVAYFNDNNTNLTEDFESFEFTFHEDGTVVGKTDLFSETGFWFYESTSEKGEQLILNFPGTTPFDLITYPWTIVSLNVSKVELMFKPSGEDATKLLTFEKF